MKMKTRGLFQPTLLIPFVVVAYSLYSMRIMPDAAGILDHLVFIVLCFLVFDLLLEIPKEAFRIFFTFALLLAISIFFLSNSLYYRFFNTWGQADMFRQWQDVPKLWQGILMLSSPLDFIFYFLVPIVLWQFSMREDLTVRPKSKVLMLVFLLMVFSARNAMGDPSMSYVKSNPFFYMVRNKTLTLSLAKATNKKMPITAELSGNQLINESLYIRSKNDAYPFLKTPKPDIKPLPFALTTKPNVILVIVESLRAFEMGVYGAKTSYTPNLDQIAKESIVLKNHYAVANQTIRAEFSILASYNPDVLGGPVYVNNVGLSVLMLPAVLRDQGYETHWMEADCGSYVQRKINFLKTRGVQYFHKDIPMKQPAIGWGAADEDTFDYAFATLSKAKKPFFVEIMTLSNHWTWDYNYPTADKTPPVIGSKLHQDYTKGVFYSDYALGKFFQKLRNSPLFENTVVIVTGDHGVANYPDRIPEDNVIWRKEIVYRSPMLIWSPRLLKPRVIDTLASHLDLTPSLLDLLNIHVANPFMGTSFFRDDVPTRASLLIQDGRWNARKDDVYAYEVGARAQLQTPPYNIKGYIDEQLSNASQHVFFKANKDFLQEWDPSAITILKQSEAKEINRWINDMVDAHHTVIYRNRIYPEKTPPK